jgi:exopolysaccharide biosynthesis polyprenyl glycosylphosphotransferase
MRSGAEEDSTSRDHFPIRANVPAPHAFTVGDVPAVPAAWKRRYRIGLAISDLILLTVATVLAVVLRFGLDSRATTDGPLSLSYTGLGVAIAVAWWAMLAIFRSRDLRIIDDGAEEYRRIVRITFWLFGGLAIVSMMLKIDMSRGYLATAFPLGLALLLLNRKVWRDRLRRSRRRGRHISKVLIIGGIRSAIHMTQIFDKHIGAGFAVSGVWVPNRVAEPNEHLDVSHRFIPVLGTARTLADALAVSCANTILVTDTEHLGPEGLRELTWQLEGVDVDLMVSPNVMDMAGSRIHMRAVGTMPLLHLEEPQYAEAGAWPKLVFDRAVAFILLMFFSPILIVTALAVRFSGPGPVFYRQERIGLRGETFHINKFRSMRIGADAHLAQLLDEQGTSDRPLFKVANDPRITRVGRFIRRYSIDELPQLFNVLKGDMSLVGPRPQRQAEVDLYDDIAHRRLAVRPGMTGLWQVSGRSDLTWEESIHLDTSYVENWSMTADLMILWRTVRVVLRSDGAY